MSGELVKLKDRHLLRDSAKTHKFVTMRLENQLFGINVESVHDVLRPQKLTAVPLASREVAGLINLRGRIVTVIDMRTLMGLPPKAQKSGYMEIVIGYGDEQYSLIVDLVDEVMDLPESNFEPAPSTLNQKWLSLSSGVYRLKDELLVVLDLTSLFKNVEAKKENG